MVIAEKRIELETIEIDLRAGAHFSPEYQAINPKCTVPALVNDNGDIFTDNASIVRYLEAVYPDPPMLGGDPVEQARVAEWVARVEFDGLFSVMEALRNSSKAMVDRALPGPHPVKQIPELAVRGMERGKRFFSVLNERLEETPWLAGDAYSFADISAFVFVEFAGWVKMTPEEDVPALDKWLDACRTRPSASV
jgi:glutathione S-transferase